MPKIPIELYEYERQFPSWRFVIRFLAVLLAVLVVAGLEAYLKAGGSVG